MYGKIVELKKIRFIKRAAAETTNYFFIEELSKKEIILPLLFYSIPVFP